MAKTTKPRVKNLYFRPVEDKRKSCSQCKQKLLPGETIWSAGEYICGKWRNAVDRFCCRCFQTEVINTIEWFKQRAGMDVAFVPYHAILPAWLTLEPGKQDGFACETAEQRGVYADFLEQAGRQAESVAIRPARIPVNF